MKKVFTLFVFLLALPQLGFSQEKESFNNLTSGKWNINSVTIENEIMNVSKEGHWLVFHANGLYQLMLDKEEQIGTWSLNEANELKFDIEDFKGNSHLGKLSDHELNFSISGYSLVLSK